MNQLKKYFEDTLKEVSQLVDSELKKFSPKLFNVFKKNDPLKTHTVDFIARNGKKFRPTLAYFVANEFSNYPMNPFLSLELIHKFLLIHDDIIDKDEVRYGSNTVHTALRLLYSKTSTKNQRHIGNSAAIIAGNMVAAEAIYPILEDQVLSASIKLDLVKLITDTVGGAGYGEYTQFLQDYKKISEVSLDDIRESIRWVTGKYTTEFPIKFGLTIAERPDLITPELSSICESVGMIFQATDDYLGVFGNPKESGKSNLGDLVQGKKTFILYYGYRKASKDEKKFLDEKIGTQMTLQEVEEIKRILRRGIDDYLKLLKDESMKIEKNLKKVALPQNIKNFLAGFTEFLLTREK